MPLLSEQNRRKRNLVVIGAFLLLIGGATAFDLGIFAPELPVASNIVIFALFNLNLIVFLLLLLLLFRNLIKVWFERRQQVIGARFKAKLVLAFLLLSVTPAALIFVIASNFINKSIEGWFKPQVERPLDQALAVAQTYYNQLERTAVRHGQHIARVIERDALLGEDRREALASFLLEQKVRGISTAFREYKQLKLLKNPIKGIYILLFLLMTLIVVFSFTWFALYLARGITGPIEQLAEGTREVAAGNLSYKVQARGDDEIGVLVESFNRMTDDLAKSKRKLEEAYFDLSDKHTELEDRRVYIETVLEAITTGVVSFDPLGRLTTINRAAARMLGVNEATAVGRFLEEVFAGPDLRAVVAQMQRTRRPRAASTELEFQLRRGGATLSLLASATALRGPGGEDARAAVVLDELAA